jgi:protein-tyrosine phosphatase
LPYSEVVITDVGGIAAANGTFIRTNTVFRLSGGLAGPDELATLRAARLRCVVDLRGDTEDRTAVRDWAAANGVGYEAQPIPAADRAGMRELVSSGATVADAAAAIDGAYRTIVDSYGAQIAGTIGALARELPAGFGCAAGKDRTGIVAAFLHRLLGADVEDVVHHYTVSAPPVTRLAVLAKDYFGVADGDALPPAVEVLLSTRPDTMRAILAHVQATHGSIEQYLVDHGLGADAVDHLRARLVVAEAA